MQFLSPARRPFEGCRSVALVCATPGPDLRDEEAAVLARLPEQLLAEAADLQRELGAPVHIAEGVQAGPAWYIGPACLNPCFQALGQRPARQPQHRLDRGEARLFTDAPDVAGLLQTFAFLRSLARSPGGTLPTTDVRTLDEAVRRVAVEVSDSVPRLRERFPGWAEACRFHRLAVRGSTNPIAALQRWLTPLGDFHTWVRPARTSLVLPYGARVVRGQVMLTHVHPRTRGYAAGARPGWFLRGLDVRTAWNTTPGAPHARPQLVARRLLSGTAGEEREWEARAPGGATARWYEAPTPPTGPPASWTRLSDGTGYLWVGAWLPDLGVDAIVDDAFEALASAPGLIVDLRGNAGGRIAMAEAFRSRFLRGSRTVGFIQRTLPGGRLGPRQLLTAEPAAAGRWLKPVRFLTDPLTWSAAEDALLGLQGLPHVQIVGQPSGGGSGRVRRMRLLPGWRLTVSTALTFDARGRCIEGHGIPVDLPVPVDAERPPLGDPTLDRALAAGW